MKTMLLMLFVCLSGIAFCQKVETIDRLNAAPFPENQTLSLTFNPNASAPFTYTKDPRGKMTMGTQQDIPQYFSYKDRNEENIEVVCEFVNPMSYRISLSFKYTDDPNEKVISTFMESVTPSLEGLPDTATPAARNGTGPSSKLLPDWMYLLQLGHSEEPGFNDYFTELGNAFEELEKYLIGEFKIDNLNMTFEKHVTMSTKSLKDANSFQSYSEAKDKANTTYNELIKITEAILSEKLKVVREKMKSPQFAVSAPFIDYTDFAILKLNQQFEEKLNAKKSLLGAYKVLLDDLNKVKFENNKIKLTVEPMKFKAKKDIMLTITATPISVNESDLTITQKEKEKKESQVTIIRKRAQVEVSAGIAFFSKEVAYNSFGITTDSIRKTTSTGVEKDTVVQRVGNTQDIRWAIPTIFLNYYRLAGDDNLFIFPQVGVGSGKKFPTLFLGAGYVIPNRIIISFGLANILNQELKKEYTEGGLLKKQIEAKSLSETRWAPRLYFSVQLKF